MRRFVVYLAVLVMLVVGQVEAVTVGFVNNPIGNSTDWTNFVTGLGGTVNSNVNFNSHPIGALQSNFYLGSDGVTLTASGDVNTVTSGAGPGQANTGTTPKSTGEGLHPSSNYLSDGGSPSSLTMSFNTPVWGAGLFVIDYFNPYSTNPLTIEGFTGPSGTGTSLGSFSSVAFNFQKNYMYFMGIGRTEGDIRSVVFTDVTSSTGDVTGIDDIRFASAGSAPIPEPTTLTLFSLGTLGLVGYGWRRRNIRARR